MILQQIATNTGISLPHIVRDVKMLLITNVVFLVVQVLFLATLYKAMNKVPAEKHYFRSWFLWLILISSVAYILTWWMMMGLTLPYEALFFRLFLLAHVIGFAFMWMMLPWGVARTLKAGVAGNLEAEKRAESIFVLGLATVILYTISDVPYIGSFAPYISSFAAYIGSFTVLAYFISFIVGIIYWVKVSKFRRNYLQEKK